MHNLKYPYLTQHLKVIKMFSIAQKQKVGEMVINIQLSPEGEVNSGGYIPRREASRYISTALHRP